MYEHVILFHSFTAFTSITLFTIRSLILFYIKENKYRKISYVIDSCLAVSGATLAYMGNRIPGIESWISIKLFLIILYVILGIISFKAKNLKIQLIFWVASMLTIIYIFKIAYSKNFYLFLQ